MKLRARHIASFAAIAIILIAAVLLSSPGRVAVTNQCAPDSLLSELRFKVQGARFWREQVESIDAYFERRARAHESEKKREREFALMRAQSSKLIQEIEEKYPNSRPTPAQQMADRLREQADAIEARETELFIKQVESERAIALDRCRDLFSFLARHS